VLQISARSSFRKWFKKLEILPVPSWYIYSLILFIVDYMRSLRPIPLFTKLMRNVRINYIYLQLDFLLYRTLQPTLLLRYSTNYHLESQDLKW